MSTDGQCWRCWWAESGRCYNDKIATITVEGNHRKGQLINMDLREECMAFHSFLGKREVYERVIPSDMLVITSEENMKAQETTP